MDYFECYLKAGKIASEVRQIVKKKNHIGNTLCNICEWVENEIRTRDGAPAFPVNVSLNHIAAHYTAEPGDTIIVKDGDILKIDIGVHVDGYIADTAATVCYDPKYDSLVRAAESALNEATRISRANTKAGDIGRIIEYAISHYGLKPIQNLSGHSLDQFTIHAGKSIPNIKTIGSSFTLVANQAYAIEPFVTTKNGQGVVYEGKIRNIFSIISRKPSKEKEINEFLETVWNLFKTLPFAIRWLIDKYEEREARRLIEYLIHTRNIHAYPVLVEGNSEMVAQAEHTIIPLNDSVNIITQ